MRFIQTPLAGAWVIELERLSDERGWFARTFDAEEFAAHGLNPAVVQCNASFNARRGTLRGMHYQAEPHGESKLVRCVRGAIFDVAVDLRGDSAYSLRWHGVELSAENGSRLLHPGGARPRLPDARGRLRGALPDGPALRARGGPGGALG